MKEIHLIHVVESAGRHSWFEKLLTYLDGRGFSQIVVTLDPLRAESSILETRGLKRVSPTSSRRLRGSVEVISLLRKARKKGSTNFLVLQGHKASILGFLFTRFWKMGYAIIHHVQPEYFEMLKEEKPFRALVHGWWYRKYVTHATIIQSLSAEVTAKLISVGCDPKRIVSVGHGVNFETFRMDLGADADDPLIDFEFPRLLIVARLAWEKNYELALEVFEQLQKTFPKARLNVAGTGPLEEELRELVDEKGLGESVVFLGRVTNIAKLMKQSDLLLHLAKTESYGQVYVEACLANLPIFTFATGVAIDLAEQKEPLVHILVDKSPDLICKQIGQFLANPRELRSIPQRSFEHFSQHDEKVVFQGISDYLTDLAHGSD